MTGMGNLVLDGGLIKGAIIHAEMPRPVWFLDEQHQRRERRCARGARLSGVSGVDRDGRPLARCYLRWMQWSHGQAGGRPDGAVKTSAKDWRRSSGNVVSSRRKLWRRLVGGMSLRGDPMPFQSMRRPWCHIGMHKSSKSQRIGPSMRRIVSPSTMS